MIPKRTCISKESHFLLSYKSSGAHSVLTGCVAIFEIPVTPSLFIKSSFYTCRIDMCQMIKHLRQKNQALLMYLEVTWNEFSSYWNCNTLCYCVSIPIHQFLFHTCRTYCQGWGLGRNQSTAINTKSGSCAAVTLLR